MISVLSVTKYTDSQPEHFNIITYDQIQSLKTCKCDTHFLSWDVIIEQSELLVDGRKKVISSVHKNCLFGRKAHDFPGVVNVTLSLTLTKSWTIMR